MSFEYLGKYKTKKSKEELEPIDNYEDLDKFIEKHKIVL